MVIREYLTADSVVADSPSGPLQTYQVDQDVPSQEVEWHGQEVLEGVAQ